MAESRLEKVNRQFAEAWPEIRDRMKEIDPALLPAAAVSRPPCKVYVASSWRNEYQQTVVAWLRDAGYRVYDFKGAGDGWGEDAATGPGGFSWSEVDPRWKDWVTDVESYLVGLEHPRAVEGFLRDMDALRQSEICIMVMPCGPSASMEMGWACGAGRRVAVYIPAMREPDLMVKMAALVTDNWKDIEEFCAVGQALPDGGAPQAKENS